MNTAIQIFNFQNSNVRTATINDELWFVAKDVCDVLGIKNSRQAVSRLDEDEKGVILNDTPGGIQEVAIVSESGAYFLIARSDKPVAREFDRWVRKEVLPTIRKTGSYSVAPAVNNDVSALTSSLSEFLPALATKVVTIDQSLTVLSERVDAINPDKLVSDSTDGVIARLKALGEYRGELHKLKGLIVKQAMTLPADDVEAKSWRQHNKVWRAIHRHVGVGKLDDYVTVEQFERGILFAKNQLRLLGMEPPVQLRLVG